MDVCGFDLGSDGGGSNADKGVMQTCPSMDEVPM